MKITLICQYPWHHIHNTWMKSIMSVNNKMVYYIPQFITKSKILTKSIWFNPILNQLCALLQSSNIPSSDIYLVEGFKAILPAILNKKKNRKIILINSDTFLSTYSKQNFFTKMIYKWYIRNVDYFICTSHMMANLTSRYSSAPKYVVYPYYEKDKFSNVSCDLNSPNICSIATARFCKRPDIMIAAFKIFRKKYPTAQLFICDGGEYGGEGLRKSHELIKNNPGVILTGYCNPVPYLRKSGLYINTAEHESFGINILEAMVAGIPPVISQFCGAKDLVEQVDPALICRLNPTEFANKLIDLQRNKKRKKELGKKSKEIARKYIQEYSIDEFKKTIKLIIDDIHIKQKH